MFLVVVFAHDNLWHNNICSNRNGISNTVQNRVSNLRYIARRVVADEGYTLVERGLRADISDRGGIDERVLEEIRRRRCLRAIRVDIPRDVGWKAIRLIEGYPAPQGEENEPRQRRISCSHQLAAPWLKALHAFMPEEIWGYEGSHLPRL
jgi:hypothetical protein